MNQIDRNDDDRKEGIEVFGSILKCRQVKIIELIKVKLGFDTGLGSN